MRSTLRRRLLVGARFAVGIAVSLGLGWLVIRGLEWGQVRESLAGVSIPILVLAVLVFMFASWLKAVRWRMLFVGEKLTVARLFIIQNEGLGLNNVMPIRVASEPVQLAILTIRDGVPGAKALATLGMERVIDVVASTMILGIAFFLVPEMKNFTLYVWGAIGFTVVAVGLVRAFAWSSEALAFVKRIPFLAAFATAVRDLERERLRLAGSLLTSVASWMMMGVTAWMVAVAIDLPISPVTATLVTMGTIFFATAVPAAPSAIGTFEFAVVYVLEFFGVERAAGFGFAVIIHAVFFLPPTAIAALFLPREGIMSLRRLRKLATMGDFTR